MSGFGIKLWFGSVFAFVVRYWRVIGLCAVFIVLLVVCIVWLKSCDSEPKLDQPAIIDLQNQIDDRQREQLANTFNSVDNGRVNTNENARRAEENTKQATNKNYSNKNNQDLADELERKTRNGK